MDLKRTAKRSQDLEEGDLFEFIGNRYTVQGVGARDVDTQSLEVTRDGFDGPLTVDVPLDEIVSVFVPLEIRLRGVGLAYALPAAEVEEGDVLIWNHGYRADVEDVEATPSGKSVRIYSRPRHKDGEISERLKRSDSLVAVERLNPELTTD